MQLEAIHDIVRGDRFTGGLPAFFEQVAQRRAGGYPVLPGGFYRGIRAAVAVHPVQLDLPVYAAHRSVIQRDLQPREGGRQPVDLSINRVQPRLILPCAAREPVAVGDGVLAGLQSERFGRLQVPEDRLPL